MFTIQTVTGTIVVLTAIYVLIAKNQPVEALAGETTLANAVASAETRRTDRAGLMHTRTDWQLTTVSRLCDAEELLDVLENQGFAERELVVLGNSTFAVRWR
jgi:predicted transcriptional regulator